MTKQDFNMPNDPIERDFRENVLPSLIPGISKNVCTGLSSGDGKFDVNLGSDFALGTPYDPYDPCDPQSTRFVHFTSLRNLHSIVNENAVRLYNMTNSNDPNEYFYFDEDHLLEDKDSLKDKRNTYILSLCDARILKSDNILNLWRLYGDEGWGAAIEFEIQFDSHSSDDCYFLGNIIYEKPKLEDFNLKVSEFEMRNSVKTNPKKVKRVPKCFHKKSHYKIEEEVRLMFFRDGSTIEATHCPEENRFKWDFNSRHELVTYNKLKLGSGRGPWIMIKKIHLGFRHSEEFFENKKRHFDNLFLAMQEKKLMQPGIELPEIKHSPLGKIYH